MCQSCKLFYQCIEEVISEAYQLSLVSNRPSRFDLVRLLCIAVIEEDICASCLVKFLYNLKYLDKLLPHREFFPSEAKKFLDAVSKGEEVNPEGVQCQQVCKNFTCPIKV